MLEKKIEDLFVKRVLEMGGQALKLNSASGAGLPDRLILIPRGKIAFVEFKAPGKKPRPLQEYMFNEIRSIGFRVYVVDRPEKIGGVINEIFTAQLSENGNR